MPTQLFYSVTIPVTYGLLQRTKSKRKTLFINARNMGHMIDRKHRNFEDEDIDKLANTFADFQNGTLEDVKDFAQLQILRLLQNKIISLPRQICRHRRAGR